MEKNKLSQNSSIFVSVPALLLWLVLAAVSAACGYEIMTGLFGFFLLFFSAMRYWAAKAMDGVSLEVQCSRRCLYPGMDTELEYTVKNEKFLPLMWLELSQVRPERDCILPDSSFQFYKYMKDEEGAVREICACKRGFSLVMGYESMHLSSTWHAEHRGIYRPEEFLLRSGDGFGLSQEEKSYPAELMPEIVVYPKKVLVDCEMLLRSSWEKSYGALGFKEDISILRGTRPYTGVEPWKRINWRMAARQPGQLNVNFYETVQPASIVFILDGESYCGDTEALENCLEIMASLIAQLQRKSVSCGLCLPKSSAFTAINISAERQPSTAELLYYLAGYNCLMDPVKDKQGNPSGRYYPSRFPLRTLFRSTDDAGTVALFTNDPESLDSALIAGLDASRLMVFSSGKLKSPDGHLRVIALDVLRKGGKS